MTNFNPTTYNEVMKSDKVCLCPLYDKIKVIQMFNK